MVNNGGNQFQNIFNGIPDKKIVIRYFILKKQFLIECNPDWIYFG